MANLSSNPIAELKNLQIERDDRKILDITELKLPLSGITALVGPNGSGKTTLLKVLHGLLTPTQGKVQIPSHTALVLHHTPLIKGSVFLNLSLIKDASPQIKQTEIDQVLSDFGLSALKHQIATKLSAGERQRLSLARAKLQKTPLVLLDEPTANLDPSATDQIEELIQKMSQEGVHFIIATHDLGQVKRLAHQVLLLSKGQVAEFLDTTTFFNGEKSALTHQFLNRQLGWQSPR